LAGAQEHRHARKSGEEEVGAARQVDRFTVLANERKAEASRARGLSRYARCASRIDRVGGWLERAFVAIVRLYKATPVFRPSALF
jgi:hypothetical protein